MEKECPECKDTFTGRVDKKFCCDQCRNSYNNRLNKDANNFCRNINRILKNNRKILENFVKNKKHRTTKEKLLNSGYNFDYMTNVYKTKTGKVYHFCYDFGYIESDNNSLNIVERKEYVD